MPLFRPPADLNTVDGVITAVGAVGKAGVSGLAADAGHVHPAVMHFVSGAQSGLTMSASAGVSGTRIGIVSDSLTGSAEIMLVPGPNAPQGQLNAQIQWINQTDAPGAGLERLAITAVSSSYIIDTSVHAGGIVRPIVFQAQGTAAAVTQQNALIIEGDASVLLRGDHFTDANGVSFGANRTTLADWSNSGSTRFIMDTRTTTPASNAADSTFLDLRRGGAIKALFGLNVAGLNLDTLDSVVGGNLKAYIQATGKVLTLGNRTIDDRNALVLNADAPRLYWQVGAAHSNWKLSAQDSQSETFVIASGPAGADATAVAYTDLFAIGNTGNARLAGILTAVGGVGNETVGHSHGHTHGSHDHTLNIQGGTIVTAIGFDAGGNLVAASGPNPLVHVSGTTPALDAAGESAVHTHKG